MILEIKTAARFLRNGDVFPTGQVRIDQIDYYTMRTADTKRVYFVVNHGREDCEHRAFIERKIAESKVN